MGRLQRCRDWVRMRRERLEARLAAGASAAVPWTALRPGALLFACGFLGYNLAVTPYFAPRAARAPAVSGSLGVALVLLVSLFLFSRLAVAAAELNATLWERRAQPLRLNAPPP